MTETAYPDQYAFQPGVLQGIVTGHDDRWFVGNTTATVEELDEDVAFLLELRRRHRDRLDLPERRAPDQSEKRRVSCVSTRLKKRRETRVARVSASTLPR